MFRVLRSLTWIVPLAVLAAASPTATAAAEKDTLVVAQTVDPPTLTPYETTAPYMSVFANIVEPLMYWESEEKGNTAFRMHLATEYKWLDNVTLQFKLRQGSGSATASHSTPTPPNSVWSSSSPPTVTPSICRAYSRR